MQKSLLTAIIFTYNHEKYIERCIESHLKQKTSYDYKIKIYDDCSTDGTTEICKKFAAEYPNRIELILQKENTFTKPYLQLQSYQAISEIDTKYFCICDGDDYWCNDNKIQLALDFLEKHLEYHGFVHDTYIENIYTGERRSYIHDECKVCKIENPVLFDAKSPFFLVSSRIFRTTDYVNLKVLPIDYLQYYYHLSKGSVYYYDCPMSVYSCGINNTYNGLPIKFITDNCAMMTYRLSKLFNFKQDIFCTELLLMYEKKHNLGMKRYKLLCSLKSILGIKIGWTIWFILNFVMRYGFSVENINYIYDRKKVKKHACPEKRQIKLRNEIIKLRLKCIRKYREYNILKSFLNYKKILSKNLIELIKQSLSRKRRKVCDYNKKRHAMIKYKI